MPHPRPAGRLCFTCISLSHLVLSCLILYYLVLSCLIFYQLALSCIISYYLVLFRDIVVGRSSHGNALPVPSSYRFLFSVLLSSSPFFMLFLLLPSPSLPLQKRPKRQGHSTILFPLASRVPQDPQLHKNHGFLQQKLASGPKTLGFLILFEGSPRGPQSTNQPINQSTTSPARRNARSD